MHWVYYAGRALTRVLLFLFTRWRVYGKENIPVRGPLLVMVNHIHLADPPIIALSIGRRAMFIAKEELFRPGFSGYIVRNFGAFPVRRQGVNRETLRRARQWLTQGMALIVFPEGRRSSDTRLEAAYSGPALIARHSGAPVLPVAISGTEKIRGKTGLLRRPEITVNIGAPFYPSSGNGKMSREQLEEMTHSIMWRIAALLPSRYRGRYTGYGVTDNEN